VSLDGRYVLVQTLSKALNEGWLLERDLYDLKNWPKRAPSRIRLAETATQKRPSPRKFSPALRTRLARYAISTHCKRPSPKTPRALRAKVISVRRTCRVEVRRGTKVVASAAPKKNDGGAMAGAGFCDGNKTVWRWYPLPKRRGWLLEAESIMKDPAMGEQTVGHLILFVP
jgi:hypothetical protein